MHLLNNNSKSLKNKTINLKNKTTRPPLNRKKIFSELKNYFIICIGLAIFAFGWTAFLIPAQMTGGGVSGISAIIYFASGIPIGTSTLVINVVLLAIAWKVLDLVLFEYAFCTIVLHFFWIGQKILPNRLL